MSTSALVNYHVRSEARQAFRFDVGGVIGNLESPELVPTRVEVDDLRDGKRTVDFAADGITFEQFPSAESRFDNSRDWEAAYDLELTKLLRGRINAREVIVFDHTVRVDDPGAPRKPARNVHNDYSTAGARQRVIDLVGSEAARDYEAGHYAFINVWRPIERPIDSSPLGFIRPESIEPDDWMTIDLIYPDRVGQILGVAANASHSWFYLSRMRPDEVVIFNIYDNRGRPFLGHSALDMIEPKTTPTLRKSIESRTLVRFG
ncbi:MAG: CmcJ/NvfI family oxidoreductase [Pseudomonadota bacterium]